MRSIVRKSVSVIEKSSYSHSLVLIHSFLISSLPYDSLFLPPSVSLLPDSAFLPKILSLIPSLSLLHTALLIRVFFSFLLSSSLLTLSPQARSSLPILSLHAPVSVTSVTAGRGEVQMTGDAAR
ncbi:hypothetical protein E2C01_027476 [Portunus trituberculatus]|uniref:Transmembrane protein n=1 Tax=Portunus trituberculatus TaxID=210409 RepID=A0A5B7EL95_PORTR|nr:hypothetical protein [Portunus trituberculatus]